MAQPESPSIKDKLGRFGLIQSFAPMTFRVHLRTE
jgi:hypothetical protein